MFCLSCFVLKFMGRCLMKKFALVPAFLASFMLVAACSSPTVSVDDGDDDDKDVVSGNDVKSSSSVNKAASSNSEDESPNSVDGESSSSSADDASSSGAAEEESSSSVTYVEEADTAVVQELLTDSVSNETNVETYEIPYHEDEFQISQYTVFFATMNPASVKDETITVYFDGLNKNANKYLLVYYLPDDFDYNSAAVSGGEATLVFKAPIKAHLADDVYPEDVYPDDEFALTHCQFTSGIDDVIHTNLKWDGVHKQVMIITSTNHKSSTILLSETSGRSLLFAQAPSWVGDAYEKSVDDTFVIPPSTIDSSAKVYFRSEKGILVTTKSGEVSEEDVENVLGGRGELIK